MLTVGVIGAGASGLVAARLLSANQAAFAPPVVFEQAATIGGTWVYTDQAGNDKHGLPVHSSIYRNLRYVYHGSVLHDCGGWDAMFVRLSECFVFFGVATRLFQREFH